MQRHKFFLNAFKGSFSSKSSENEEKVSFTQLTGHLVNISFKTTDFGEAMRLHLVDQHNFYMVSMFLKSRIANAFFMMVKNIDVDHPITLRINLVSGKDYLIIHQFGGPVIWYYSQENANELPMNSIDRTHFFKQNIFEETIPQLQRKTNPYPYHQYYKPSRKGLQGGYFDGYANPTQKSFFTIAEATE